MVGELSLSHQVCFLLFMLTNDVPEMGLRYERLQNLQEVSKSDEAAFSMHPQEEKETALL